MFIFMTVLYILVVTKLKLHINRTVGDCRLDMMLYKWVYLNV